MFLLVDRVLAFDHETGRVIACGMGLADDRAEARARADAAVEALAAAIAAAPAQAETTRAISDERPDEAIDPASYAKAVDHIKEEIAAGNVYQACLSSRERRAFGADPWQLYRALRRVNPAPFACFLELPEVAVVGSSPERFLHVTRDGQVESRPVKGTAARGRDPIEDRAHRAALASSE